MAAARDDVAPGAVSRLLHPLVAAWFQSRFGEPTEPQERGWPVIAASEDVLITAPTGSGKTLAAFLIAIDRLLRQAVAGELRDGLQVVYVSPLKALANDVHKNLEQPLAEIRAWAWEQGLLLPEIRVAVRSGDTPARERQAIQRHPPHILVTTPESLYILLTSVGGRRLLASAGTTIVDEIHVLAGNKRGAHLALSLERLDALVAQHAQGSDAGAADPVLASVNPRPRPQRIGLSATVKPVETVAAYLAGSGRRARQIVVPDRRRLDLAIEVPAAELGPVADNEQWEDRYNRLAALAEEHRSTLVFVSTRRLAERVAHRLRARLGDEAVEAHHGSLSRRIRLRAEERFKAGKLKVMVATASLELGLDIGTVDLVCQIGSPRVLATAWQRIGRAGHWKGATPKGRFFATTRDDLLECAAAVAALRAGELDRLRPQPWPRDILAQQMVAAVASGEWGEDDLWRLVRRAWPYRHLPRAEFDALVALLSEGIDSGRGRRGALLHRDGVHHRLRARRGARLAAITGGGAIIDNATYVVEAEPENVVVGTLDEDFAIESNAGDVFLLGTTSWKVRGVETGRVRVEDAHGQPPTIPFWRGEAPSRGRALSAAASDLRRQIADRNRAAGPAATAEWLRAHCGLDGPGAAQLVAYVAAGEAALGGVPTMRHVIAERFFDEGGGMQLVIHAPFGAAINKAWGMALRKRFCRGFDFELQASASDNGLVLALGEQHSFPLETIFQFLTASGVEPILAQAVLQAPLFGTRWRWTVSRSLALLRWRAGRKLAPQLQRMRAEDLLAAAFPMALGCQDNHGGDVEIPDHPYVQETLRDCLQEAMDLSGLQALLRGLELGAITFSAVDTPAPSLFAHEICNVGPFGFLDDAPLEERRSRAVDMRRNGPGTAGRLEPGAVAAVCAEAFPDPVSDDEMHDLLLSLVWLPESEAVPAWLLRLQALAEVRRVLPVSLHGRRGWIAAERERVWQAILALHGTGGSGAGGAGAVALAEREVGTAAPAPGDAEAAMMRLAGGWMEILGPVTVSELAGRLGCDAGLLEGALLGLENQGRVLRLGGTAPVVWCERGLLARIHRRMIARRRAEIEPVSPAAFYAFLRRWQHVAPGTRLHGLDGLRSVLAQLEGFEAPASAWEESILPARVSAYEPALLDQLCLSGEIGWARLAPGARRAAAGSTRPPAPTRNSPMTFFRREEAGWLLEAAGWRGTADHLSSEAAEVLAALERRGACFFADLARLFSPPPGAAENGGPPALVKSQLERALWELVAAGLVTADGFDNLRAFLDPRRRAGRGAGRQARPRHSLGRWALVRSAIGEEPAAELTPAEQELRLARLAERQALLWMRRYGVIFRALVEREPTALSWYSILLACRRLEAREEIRGGRFVSGFAGEQYALPHAVEALRLLRADVPTPREEGTSAADPLHLRELLPPEPALSLTTGS